MYHCSAQRVPRISLLSLASTPQHSLILVIKKLDQFLTRRTKVFAGIEFTGIVGQKLAHLGGHNKSAIRIDIDFADSFDLVYEVNQRVSGDQAALIVEREGEQINLDVTFAPLPKADEHGMGKHKK